MENNKYPRTLVFANNSFSKSNSNGRTLGSLFVGWPKDYLAQFCISTDGPDTDVCNNYFCITDADVLHSLLSLKPVVRRRLENADKINANYVNGKKKHHKTALKMLLRNFAWNIGFWKGKDFYNWVDDFKPEIILVQSGDSFFMHDLARSVAQKYSCKLAIFNTEGPYLFSSNYFAARSTISEKIFFPIYRSIYNQRFRKFMKEVYSAVYGNSLLQSDYEKVLPKPLKSCVIYTGSDVEMDVKPFNESNLRFSYIGNMGFLRPKALVQVSEVLQRICPEYFLDVYGEPQTSENEDLLNSAPGIRFHGVVDYSTVKKIISASDFLFHVEFDSPLYAESLKYGFSTKIADSLKSRRVFVLFAPKTIACSRYIIETGAGIYASNTEELESKLREIISNTEYREELMRRAHNTAESNHNIATNSKKLADALGL